MALPWLVTVAVVFMLVFVLTFLNVPSRFFSSAPPLPSASVSPSSSAVSSASTAP
jgi:nitric oxide reductase large subunit